MNIFAVLDTSDAEDEVVQKVTKTNKTKETSNDAKQSNNAKATNNSSTKPASSANPKTTKPQQSAAKPAKAEKGENKPAQAAAETEAKEVKDDNRGGRPRGKEGNRRGEKHHGVSEEEKQRRPKREFERRSGTGRGKEVSRGGRGPYGFGNVEQEAQDAEKDPSKAEVGEDVPAETVEDAAEPEPESIEVVPDEPPTLSFDDFMKRREEARSTSTFAPKNVRSVNIEAQFSGLTVKSDENAEEEDKLNKQGSKRDQRSTTKTQVLDVQFKFENPNEFRGKREFNNKQGRGGRGEGRGAGRGPRRPRQNNPPAQLNSGDFPSL